MVPTARVVAITPKPTFPASKTNQMEKKQKNPLVVRMPLKVRINVRRVIIPKVRTTWYTLVRRNFVGMIDSLSCLHQGPTH